MTILLFLILLAQGSDSQQVCAPALAKAYSAPPEIVNDSSLKGCDAVAAYYGLNGKADPLRCGLYERAHPDPSHGGPFYGVGVLSMIYANGKGVARDYNLAIRFTCENTFAAPAEIEGRIAHLEKLRDSGASSAKFDLCDDATSGLTMGACASIQQSFADAKRTRHLEAITARFSAAAKQALPALRAAEKRFDDARARNEVDLSGSGRGAFELEEEGRLKDQFLINLQRFSKGDIPPAAALDAQLDAALRKATSQSATGTVTADGIRKTEEAWIALREQWIAFARIAWPSLSAERVRAQLNRLRIHQLRSLVI